MQGPQMKNDEEVFHGETLELGKFASPQWRGNKDFNLTKRSNGP